MKNTTMVDAIYNAAKIRNEAGQAFIDVYDNLYDIELHYAIQENEHDTPIEELREQINTDLSKTINKVLTILRDNPSYIYDVKQLFTKLENERIANEIREIDNDILVNAR